MKKLNTHEIYRLSKMIDQVIKLEHREGMLLGSILWTLMGADLALNGLLREQGFISPSLRRSAGALKQALRVGLPAGVRHIIDADEKTKIESWRLNSLIQAARDFETVLANELPGLPIYYVSQKGIFSIDHLIDHADTHIPETLRSELPQKAKDDVCQAGRCLAFELPTASAFHMWRALETIMDCYHSTLTGKSFAEAGVTRNWAAYIKALEAASAEKKITTFLDHIREEYRNPITHPSDTLEEGDALNLFSAGLSAISQTLKAIVSQRATSPP